MRPLDFWFLSFVVFTGVFKGGTKPGFLIIVLFLWSAGVFVEG